MDRKSCYKRLRGEEKVEYPHPASEHSWRHAWCMLFQDRSCRFHKWPGRMSLAKPISSGEPPQSSLGEVT